MKQIFSVLLVFLAFAMQSAIGQTQDFTKIEQFLDSLEYHDKFMGCVLLAKEGEPVFNKAVGFADIETALKANVETHYRIGSISKMFTTVLVLKAVEASKLRLDQKLSDFYPQVPNAEKITISMLLQHRSGIHNFTDDSDYLTYNTKPTSKDDLVKIIVKGGSEFEPDAKGEYSNSNFVLLTFILEEINQMHFAELLQKQIVGPLKLESTYVFSGIDLTKGESNSYNFNGNWVQEDMTDSSIPLGAGAINSTIKDLNVFISALFEGKLISSESLNLMMEIKDGYGRGMFSFPYYQRKSYGHTGGIDGFRSFLGYFPEEKVTIIVLSNGLNYNNNAILLALLDSYFWKNFELPNFQTFAITPEDLEKYIGEYTSDQIPLKLIFEKIGNKLIAKPSGQQATELEPTAIHTFEFKAANAVFVFDPEQKEVMLKQAGQTFVFKKQ